MAPNDGILCFSTMIQTHLSEEATQTEESGNSSLTDYGQIDDSSEEESVIERLSRLFSAVSFFTITKKLERKTSSNGKGNLLYFVNKAIPQRFDEIFFGHFCIEICNEFCIIFRSQDKTEEHKLPRIHYHAKLKNLHLTLSTTIWANEPPRHLTTTL